MNGHILPRPAGLHSRRGFAAIAQDVRHLLLWLLPTQPRATDSWHTVACAIGDVMEDLFALVAIAGTALLIGVFAIALAWLSLWLLLVAAVVAAAALGGWRLRVRARRLEEQVSDGD